MRMTEFWADLAGENIYTRSVSLGLMVVILALGALVYYQGQRRPLIIERACFSKSLNPVDARVTDEEIKSFIHEAIPIRFNSDADLNSSLISLDERRYQIVEQRDLSSKQMRQMVIIQNVKIEEDDIVFVEADRLISVGEIRSAFNFPLRVDFKQTRRTKENPYGLIVTRVWQPKATGKEREKEKGESQ